MIIFKKFFIAIGFLFTAMNPSFAQIGYQVSLLNNATGEPRANETVAVTVEITNSEGATVCSETKTETTNDFGVLSMTVGSDATFAKTDWSKLPFYISASVDEILIGRSQLLSVPVAECAKALPSCKEIIMSKTWEYTKPTELGYTHKLSFMDDIVSETVIREGESETNTYRYSTQGNVIIGTDEPLLYDPTTKTIIGSNGRVFKQ